MTDVFKGLQDAVIFQRFKEVSRDPHVKRWLTAEYAYVWNAANWRFKRVSAFDAGSALAVVAGNNKPDPPAAFAQAIELLNENGQPLLELDAATFEATYRDPSAGSGEPEAFTVSNGVILLGPTPSANRTFYLAHTRSLYHLSGAGAVVSGKMVEDDDQPAWPEDHHEVLIAGARARGKKRSQDPTWQADESERDELLGAMLSDPLLLPASRVQYGRDPI